MISALRLARSGVNGSVVASLLTSTVLLGACGFTEQSLWPTLAGEDPAGEASPPTATAQPPPQIPPTPQPPLGTTDFSPPSVTQGLATGTSVGQRVAELRGELEKLQGAIGQHNRLLQELRSKVVQDSQRYHGTIAAINARLQVGTTPGNPILVQQLDHAQSELGRVNANIGEMNKLATAIGSNATMVAYLAETSKASFSLSGAVDEDHRQLAILEDEVNRTAVLIDRLLKEVSEDVRRQVAYVATERSNLNLLSEGVKSGEIYGASLINQAMAATAFPADVTTGTNGARELDLSDRRPLVVIRFDRDDVPFQQALYTAVNRTLERRPQATFDLVAMAPSAGGPARVALNSNQARRLAERVLRSLVDMGLPPERVALSGQTSDSARTNEVHLYVR